MIVDPRFEDESNEVKHPDKGAEPQAAASAPLLNIAAQQTGT